MGLQELQDRREHFRIRDRLSISIIPIKEEDYIRVKKIIYSTPTAFLENIGKSNLIMEKIMKKIEEKDELFLYLNIIDKKLNLLISSLLSRQEEAYSLSGHREVDISGSGIRFRHPEPLETGALFELRIYLPVITYPSIATISQVLRVDEEKNEEETSYLIAFKFIEINENDRELLIKYIFMKERERLRSEKAKYR